MSPRTFVTRGAALLALAAFGLAACESKTVVTPTEFPISVTVTPAAVTLTAVNQTAQFVALVSGGPAGTAGTVTWTSSNTSVATVDANGVVTAKANGVSTISAKSTADPTKASAGVVTVAIPVVTPPTPPAAPTVSIQSITTNAGAQVDVNNAAGQINVALNVDVPTGNIINSVNVQIDGTTVCSQTFTQGTQAGVSTEAANAVVIICSIPTDKLNANGTPVYANGPHTITATLVGPGGAVKASTSQSIVFNNTSMLRLGFTAAKTANDAAGLVWNGGNLTVTLTPSVFNTQTLASAAITVTSTDINGATLTTTKSLTATGNGALTTTFFGDTTPSATNGGLKGMQNAATTITVSGVTTAGQPFSGTLGSVTLRYDAAPPVVTTQPTIAVGAFLSASSTLNAALFGSAAATDASNPLFPGVNTVTAQVQTSPSTGTAVWTNASTVAALGNQNTGALIARVVFCDALGNCTNSSATTAFGVDLVAPVINAVTSISGVQASPATVVVSAVDSGSIGVSGFGTNFVQLQIVKDSASSTGADVTRCVKWKTGNVTATPDSLASVPSSGACSFVTDPAGTSVVLNSANTGNGYYTVNVRAIDLAGNISTTTSRFFLVDNVVPVISGVSITFTTGAATASVSGNVHDNVDLLEYNSREQFAGAIIGGVTSIPFTAPTTVKAYGIPVQGNATGSVTMPIIRGIQLGFGGGIVQINGLGFSAFDQAGNYGESYGVFSTTASTGPTATDVTSTAVAVTTDPICKTGTSAACGGTTATSTLATAQVVMNPTATANPISTVYFYAVDNSGHAVYVSQTTAGALVIPSAGLPNAGMRVFTYTSGTINASALTITGANTIFAIGVDASGNGVLLGSTTLTTL